MGRDGVAPSRKATFDVTRAAKLVGELNQVEPQRGISKFEIERQSREQ